MRKQARRCSRFATSAMDTPCPRQPALAIARSMMACVSSSRICIGTFIWKTTFFFHVQWSSSRRPAFRHEFGNTITNRRSASRSQTPKRPRTGARRPEAGYGIHPDRPRVHASAGDVPGCLESDLDKRVTIGDHTFAGVDSSARSCANLRLDRNIYSRHWTLFAAEDAEQCCISVESRLAVLGVLD